MKKFTLLFLMLMAFGVSASFAQSNNDSISMVKVLGGHKFEKSGIQLSVNQIRGIVDADRDAKKQMQLAKTDEVFSYIFSYIGGFCIGYAIGDAITGHADTSTAYLAGIGVGGVAIGLGFSSLADRHVVKAANIYNMHLGNQSNNEGADLGFGFTPGGIGLTLSF